MFKKKTLICNNDIIITLMRHPQSMCITFIKKYQNKEITNDALFWIVTYVYVMILNTNSKQANVLWFKYRIFNY